MSKLSGLILAATAIAGVNEASAEPAWCNVEGLKYKIGGGNTRMDSILDKDWNRSLDAIIQGTCWPDDEGTKRKKEIDAARASWSAKLGMTEADWQDMAEWAANASAMRLYTGELKVGDWDAKYALSTLTPVQQLAGIVNGIPGASDSTTYADYLYIADALGPKLSELGRLGVIHRCSRTDRDTAAELAICESDIKVLDRKKAFEEIRADKKATPTGRMMARLMLVELDKALAEYSAAVKTWKDKDEAYGKLFEIAAATRKEWQDTHWKQETALLDLALAMDDARNTKSRKLLEGCSEKTWAAWTATVAKMPATKFVGFSTDPMEQPQWPVPALSTVTATVPGYLASVALYSCHKAEREKDPVINTLGSVMAYSPGLRGPRLAAHWAMLNAALKLDDTSETIKFANTRHDTNSRFYGQDSGGFVGTVAKIGKPDAKGMAQVTFAKKSEKQERCQKSKMTNRISHITDNGTVIYWTDCLKWGVSVIDKTPDPQMVHARYLGGLKPGMNVYIGSGVVFAAWPKAKKAPAAVFGVPVK